MREEGTGWNAELWVTWNPERKGSAVDKLYRYSTDPMIKVVSLSYRENPKFPDKLERQRVRDKELRPDDYEWIWEGAYRSVMQGAYFASSLTKAKEENRIGRVAPDPLMTIRLIADIGGTGAKADNFVFWASQHIGREIRYVNHYEKQGQPIAAHLNWLRSQGYTSDRVHIYLPHDGDTQDKVHDVSYRSAFEAAGYSVTVIPNQGKGAAMLRIEAARRLFPQMWFDEEKCRAGLDALGWYHAKRDEQRNVDLGPEHDWASHSADAFGLDSVIYELPRPTGPEPIVYKNRRIA